MALQDHENPMIALSAIRELRQYLKHFPDLQLDGQLSDLSPPASDLPPPSSDLLSGFSIFQENPSQAIDNKQDNDIKNISLGYGPTIDSFKALTSKEQINLLGKLQKDRFAKEKALITKTQPSPGVDSPQPRVQILKPLSTTTQARHKKQHPHKKRPK